MGPFKLVRVCVLVALCHLLNSDKAAADELRGKQGMSTRDLVETEGHCSTLNRDWYSYNVVPDAAIDKGIDTVNLSRLAYDLELGDLVAQESNAIYSRVSDIVSDFGEDDDGAFGYSAMLDGSLPVLVFAGTDITDVDDIMADLESATVEMVDLGGEMYSVGSGFYRHFQALINSLEPSVAEYLNSGTKEIIIAGHSLGGAIANIAAVYFANKYEARVMLRTVGAPRVFSWSDEIGDLEDSVYKIQTELVKESSDYGVAAPTSKGIITQRWTNTGDPVPAVPRCGMGFNHIGNGALDIYDGWFRDIYVYGPQHMDFTPWQTGEAWHHLGAEYLQRMMEAQAITP